MANEVSVPSLLTDKNAIRYYRVCVNLYQECRLRPVGIVMDIPLDAAAVKIRFRKS